MRNGWSYVAHETGHRFREIVWDRSGVRQLVSKLEYAGDNELAQRVYRGSLFDASVQVVLVEVASSSPAVPHRVSVGVEEWGWSRARCTTAPP